VYISLAYPLEEIVYELFFLIFITTLPNLAV